MDANVTVAAVVFRLVTYQFVSSWIGFIRVVQFINQLWIH